MRVRVPVILIVALATGLGSAAAPAASQAKPIKLTSKVVMISRATVRQYLIGVSKDGRTYKFRKAAGGLSRLRTGKVMLIPGTDAVKVARIRHLRGQLLVVTQAATLPDIVRSGTIQFRGTPDARRAFVRQWTAPSKSSHAPLRFYAPTYPYVGAPRSPSVATSAAALPQLNGTVGPYTYALKFTTESPKRLDVTGIINYNAGFRAELQVSGYVELGQDAVNVTVIGGNVSHSSFSLNNVLAHTHVTYTITSSTSKAVGNPPVLRIPVSVDFPIIGPGGIPLYFKVGAALLLKFGITSYNAVIQGGADMTTQGSDTMTQNGKQVSGSGSGDHADATILTHQNGDVGPSSSYLPSGVVVALQFPKIGVGLGVTGLNALFYMDRITSMAQTTYPAFGGLAGVDCSLYSLYLTVNAGFEAQFGPLGVEFPSKTLYENKYQTSERGCPKS